MLYYKPKNSVKVCTDAAGPRAHPGAGLPSAESSQPLALKLGQSQLQYSRTTGKSALPLLVCLVTK